MDLHHDVHCDGQFASVREGGRAWDTGRVRAEQARVRNLQAPLRGFKNALSRLMVLRVYGIQ